MIPVTREREREIGFVLMKKLVENESLRKRKDEWRPGGDGFSYGFGVDGK